MREIKTQADLNALMTDLDNKVVMTEKILIYALDNGANYEITRPIKIQTNNVNIEGVNFPKIKLTTTDMSGLNGSIISVIGVSGTELENISIKNLNLVGSKDTSKGAYGIYCSYVGKAFTTGLTSGTNRHDSTTVGYTKINKRGVIVDGCTIQSSNSYGIFLGYTSNSIIVKNTITLNGDSGIGAGNSSSNIINENIINNNNGRGIFLDSPNSNNFIITKNIIQHNNGVGVFLLTSSYNTVSENVIQNNNHYGILVNASAYCNTIVGNIIRNNSNNGIFVGGTSSYTTITSNIINNNSEGGLNISSSSSTSINGNTIENNNGYGINLASNNSSCAGNVVINNAKGVNNQGNNNTYNGNVIYGNLAENTITMSTGTGVLTTNNKIL